MDGVLREKNMAIGTMKAVVSILVLMDGVLRVPV